MEAGLIGIAGADIRAGQRLAINPASGLIVPSLEDHTAARRKAVDALDQDVVVSVIRLGLLQLISRGIEATAGDTDQDRTYTQAAKILTEYDDRREAERVREQHTTEEPS